ncbi:calcium-binding protein [Myxosarcina sp. GI1]|uniref:calcium-binding protein n=1 Tax=Myxosarcina sp. GI1 TaxID=1541065 RepID=UPI00055E4CA7|nr:calcium-binding protein [Myxosarcina sp. GI1]
MSDIEIDEVREERITMEAVVDAYDEVERAMGWYYYLEDRLNFPFQAKWISNKRDKGTEVTVVEMSPEDDCLGQMLVEVSYQEGELEDIFTARLGDIKPIDGDATTREAIADWHYWLTRGYEF